MWMNDDVDLYSSVRATADAIKETISNMAYDSAVDGLLRDLLTWAVEEINFMEIAEAAHENDTCDDDCD